MIRLLVVELRRDLARRATKLLVLAFFAVTIIGTAIAMVNIEADSADVVAAREAVGLARCNEEVSRAGAPPIDGFELNEFGDAIEVELEPVAPEDVEARCRQLLDAYLSGDNRQLWYFDDPRPNIKADLWSEHGDRSDSILLTIASLLMICGMGAGASMIGADWKYGTITTQLTWETRRVRLFAAKVLAAGIAAFAISATLMAAFCVLLYPFFATKGVTTGMDADWYLSLAGFIARNGLLTAIGAVLGLSLAMLMRSTAAAIVVVLVYLAVLENLLRAWKPHWAEWMIGDNIAVLLTGEQLETVDWEKTVIAAGLTLIGYVGLIAVAAGATFQRRDIAGAS